MPDTSLFGLTIEYVEPYSDDDKPGWKVYLPHQCDGWRIDEANAYANGLPVEWDYQGGETPYTRLPRPDEVA